MAVIVGPSDWWVASPTALNSLAISCPVGTTLPDRSRIICKAGGCAWIIAPSTTQVGSQWAGGRYNSTLVSDKCCICEWPALNTLMLNCGFNPADWFIPSISVLGNPGNVCKSQWDTCANSAYWSSTADTSTSTNACIHFCFDGARNYSKAGTLCVRAFRCVTY